MYFIAILFSSLKAVIFLESYKIQWPLAQQHTTQSIPQNTIPFMLMYVNKEMVSVNVLKVTDFSLTTIFSKYSIDYLLLELVLI